MSFWGRLFKPKIDDSLPGSGYGFRTGRASSGAGVNQTTSMQVSAVYACVRILAESIAGLPLHVLELSEEGSTEKAFDHPLYVLLHDLPNRDMTSFVWRETMMTHLLLYGNSYCQIIRNGKGEVVELYPLMPNRMKVDRDGSGNIYYEYQHGTDEPDPKKAGTVILKPRDVLHIPGLSFDGLVGYSPIAVAKNTIGLAIACEEYGASFFKNGASPSGVLEHPGILKQPDKIRENWSAVYGGTHNAGRVAVLEEGMKFSKISIPPDQAQFLETRKFQIDEIARIFRIPPHMVGDLDRATFSNIEQQSLEFTQYTLNPWVCRWEQSLMRALLKPEERTKYFIKFNLEGLLRGDYQSRMNGYSIGIQSGLYSINDCRKLENMDLIPDEMGGNAHMVNGSMVNVANLGAAYQSVDEKW